MADQERVVAVFGSGKLDPAAYQECVLLGRLLGEKGFTVVTGGYRGTMQAALEGARQAGAESIGITLRAKPEANPAASQTLTPGDFFDRLRFLVREPEAYIFWSFPGGAGTLVELATVIHYQRISAIEIGQPETKPIILILKEEGSASRIIEAFMLLGVTREQISTIAFCCSAEKAISFFGAVSQ